MITAEKLRIWRAYAGDPDAWARHATPAEKRTMTDADWHEITELLQQLTQLARGLASPEYADRIRAALRERTASADVAAKLVAMV